MFGTIAITLFIGHIVGDHWVQYHKQACGKAAPGFIGHLYCLAHVATHTATCAVALGIVWWDQNLTLDPAAVAIGLVVNAITHYIADRRNPIRLLAKWTGKTDFYALAGNGINGAYLLDQAWHIGWLLPVTLIIT